MEATAVGPAVRGFSLVGVDDPVRGKVYPITGKVVIGRDEQCGIVLDSPLVSRRHAEIEITDRGVWLHDLGSSNGTFVGDSQISSQLLATGDMVRFGRVEFIFENPAEVEGRATGFLTRHEDETRTSLIPVVRPTRPWLWGIGSFFLVAAAMAIAYLLRQ
ncbi:MAG: FHA domain-containing protein [Desulfobulbaceae bacterium]